MSEESYIRFGEFRLGRKLLHPGAKYMIFGKHQRQYKVEKYSNADLDYSNIETLLDHADDETGGQCCSWIFYEGTLYHYTCRNANRTFREIVDPHTQCPNWPPSSKDVTAALMGMVPSCCKNK